MHADLESILWKFGGDPACEKKRFAQKFTDGQTDDGRLAIVLAHSWNELKLEIFCTAVVAMNYDIEPWKVNG